MVHSRQVLTRVHWQVLGGLLCATAFFGPSQATAGPRAVHPQNKSAWMPPVAPLIRAPLSAQPLAPSHVDPPALSAGESELRKRIAKDKTLAAIPWERVLVADTSEDAAPLILWDASAKQLTDEDLPRLLNRLPAWIAAQRNAMSSATFLPQPNHPALRNEVVPLLIFSSRPAYESWQVDHPAKNYRNVAGTWDSEMGAIVCHLESKGIGETSNDLRNYLLHLRAQIVLRNAYPHLAESGPQWIYQGLCELFSISAQSKPKETLAPYHYRQGLGNLVQVLSKPAWKKEYWLGPLALFSVQGAAKLKRLPIDRKVAGKSKKTLWGLIYYFDQESALWMHFLLERDGPDAPALAACVQRGLAGSMGPSEALAALGYADEAEAEKAVLKWLEAVSKKRSGIALRPNKPSAKPVAKAKQPTASAGKATEETGNPGKNVEPVITLQPLTEEERLSLALFLASQGKSERAQTVLTKPLEGESLPPKRFTKESERLQALHTAGLALCNRAIEDGKKLRLALDGKITLIKPTGWKDGSLVLAPSKRAPMEHLEPEKLDPQFLALNLPKKSTDFGPEWLAGYAQWLSGDPAWKRSIPKTSSEIKQELEGLSDLMPLGSLVDFWVRANGPRPLGLSIESLGEQCEKYFSLSSPRPQADFMRKIVKRELVAMANMLTAEDFIAAPIEWLEDDALRITYTFDNPNELKDFQRDPELWKESLGAIETGIAEADQKPAFIESGALRMAGALAYKHRLLWEGPVTLNYEFQLIDNGSENITFNFWAGIQFSKSKSFLRGEFQNLILDKGPGKRRNIVRGGEISPSFGQVVRSVLHWSDGTAQYTFDDHEPLQGELAGTGPSEIGFWHEAAILASLESVTIQGKVHPSALLADRAEWISSREAELGFQSEE